MTMSTTSYETLLSGMWAPEGSEINERLRRLQELEQMRKEREAKRQELLKNRGTTGVITRTARIQPVEAESDTSSGLGSRVRVRRTLSMKEDNENLSGARPKVGGFLSSDTTTTSSDGDSWNLFSDVKSSILGPRRTLRTGTDYTTSYSERPTISSQSYTRSVSQPEEKEESLFADVKRSFLNEKTGGGYERKTYLNRDNKSNIYGSNGNVFDKGFKSFRNEHFEEESGDGNEIGHGNDHSENGGENGHEIVEHDDVDDEDEEPRHFIERLKNQGFQNNNAGFNFHGSRKNEYGLSALPSVPPYRSESERLNEYQYSDMPELVQPTEDILAVAQSISSSFGNKSPDTTVEYLPVGVNRSKRLSRISDESSNMAESDVPEVNIDNSPEKVGPNESIRYEIQELHYDDTGEDEGKTLKVRDSLYKSGSSEWVVIDGSPTKLDKMHEFFTGQEVSDDPNISRELDGRQVKAELERSFAEEKKYQKRPAPTTPTSVKKNRAKTPPRTKTPAEKAKKSSNGKKSSESESESIANSYNGHENKSFKGFKAVSTPVINGSCETEHNLSLEDKLAKLESMTQEKSRKRSVGEAEIEKSVPSYMSSTSASQKKLARGKDSSPKPAARDLKKDVRELKQYIREQCSESNTPVTSPTKPLFESRSPTEKKVTKEISVQTDLMIDIMNGYICKHCGKSSSDEVCKLLTEENLKRKKNDFGSETGNVVEPKISSKDSVKSIGEVSLKSDSTTRGKTTSSKTSSYMKGTTSSRLKTNTSGEADGSRKTLTPEMMLFVNDSQKSTKLSTGQKKTTSQKSREKPRPMFSLFRGNSADRNATIVKVDHKKQAMTKSKSVDQVDILKDVTSKEPEIQDVQNCDINKMVKTESKHPEPDVEKQESSGGRSPRSPQRSRPPLLSPKPQPLSPRHIDIGNSGESVESKGQFTTIVDNPFIKNDVQRSQSFKGRDKGESVWEKEMRSRDSSLKRSSSTSDIEQNSRSPSLQRSNTSVGEKSSLGQLSWSDSGSSGSLNKSRESKGSKSSLQGSHGSLNYKTAFAESKSETTSNSEDKPTTVLNLGVTGETDLDAVFNDGLIGQKPIIPANEHNEETVNKAHLEFAKRASHLLDMEVKTKQKINPDLSNAVPSDKVNGSSLKPKEQDANCSTTNGTKPKKPKKGLRGKFFKK